jgi:hypothetical protein
MKFACIVCETLLVECGPGAKTLFWIRELVLVPLSLSHFVPLLPSTSVDLTCHRSQVILLYVEKEFIFY